MGSCTRSEEELKDLKFDNFMNEQNEFDEHVLKFVARNPFNTLYEDD